ncbi:hypothetical protein BST97_00660 [Nonlabens spongiae]|uniref:Uncharacterized protein n=1 Tax=Nonlabens spongiae TaxID=331648 RepID=A0A1W6MGD0_9FLAO|nr:hypothetical protein [Nonlabens spongiae]ARN76632.1 hypothetical protein BST97_00660 [Nonlabens spongiae]
MRIAPILLILICLIMACEDQPSSYDSDLIHYIPEDSKIIIDTDDVSTSINWLQGSELYQSVRELERVQEIESAMQFLKNYPIEEESFIALSMEGRNETVITLVSENSVFQQQRSIAVDSLTYNDQKIYQGADKDHYFTQIDKVLLASSSRLVLESLIRRSISDYVFDQSFSEIYSRTGGGEFSLYFKGANDEWLKQYLAGNNIDDRLTDAYWYQVEPSYGSSGLELDGLVTYPDTVKIYQSLFNKIVPVKNEVPEIIPLSAREVKSITFSKADELINNLEQYHSNEIRLSGFVNQLFENTQEMTEIELGAETTLAFTLKPYETLFVDLDSLSSEKYTYRNQQIFKLNAPLNTQKFKPLLKSNKYEYTLQTSKFMVFAKSIKSLEEIVSNIQNGTVVGSQNWWINLKKDLSDESTLLRLTNIKKLQNLPTLKSDQDKKLLKKLDQDRYPFLVSQYVHEDEYAHYHFKLPQVDQNAAQASTGQLMSYRTDKEIISGPFLFPNHLTQQHDVAYQDEDLNLHLINNKGKKLWSKQLDAPILGNIEAVDAYKNKRQQLVFATDQSVYFLDRNGRDVNAFPYKISGGITQPLSVFDYDNNRNYRFLATSGSKLVMLNRDGKIVTGFKYQPTSDVITQPQHHRVRTKDYIVFGTADNTLRILSRVGKIRTPVKTKINISQGLFFEDGKALIPSTGEQTVQVDLGNGSISKSKDVLKKPAFAIKAGLEFRQKNNELSINGKEVDLPYGTYENGKIFTFEKESYVAVLEQGENKIYIFDMDGDLIAGLPVYGSKSLDLAKSNFRYLVTQDERDIILYKW